MSFDQYARYYDLIYREKDYGSEARYVGGQIRGRRPEAKRILELGCGTLKHAIELAGDGFQILGIDQSSEMLGLAERNYSRLSEGLKSAISFKKSDIGEFRTAEKFDAAISLFHVASYHTTEESLGRFIETARQHLAPGGIFLFDYWYGPAVEKDPPTYREKDFENEEIRVKRIARPESDPKRHVIDVHYDVTIEDKSTGEKREIHEKHPMRYWFEPELSDALGKQGFRVVSSLDWMKESAPSDRSWNGFLVAELE